MGLKTKLGGAIFLAFLVASPVYAEPPPTVDDVARQLICQCGCLMILNNCSHAECSSRESMTATIRKQLEQGQSSTQIVQSFVAQFGEQVLASPTKKGFNLTAWIAPFAGILAGAAAVYFAIKAWVRKGRQEPELATPEVEEGEEEYLLRVDRELKEFEERGFR